LSASAIRSITIVMAIFLLPDGGLVGYYCTSAEWHPP
jgi:hypothetical protein